jgi:hypothetical protein
MADYSIGTPVADPRGLVQVRFVTGQSMEVAVNPGETFGDAAALAAFELGLIPPILGGDWGLIEHYVEYVSFDPKTNVLTAKAKQTTQQPSA